MPSTQRIIHKYKWTVVCSAMARKDAPLLMEDIKRSDIVKCQLVARAVCALTRPHAMCYQLLPCWSKTYKTATPYDACPWLGKVITCRQLWRPEVMKPSSDIYASPQSPLVSRTTAERWLPQRLKPARIYRGMARKHGLSKSEILTLRQTQWFVSSCTKKHFYRNVDNDDIDQLAHGPGISAVFSRMAAGSHKKRDVGTGSDENPFLVGFTSKHFVMKCGP
ncbi:unnamed protein product [Phytophthora fragariaefolia]|uniref:Unnamed protein product n=1 Tax=Phytophthora fragariaefolia TaxID=1490495 RepID=A0A9W6XWC7_9STRA|nr:unnamed protein product [Phytophthora fragariaefolia]